MAPAPWLSTFFSTSQVGWPGEGRWQVGLAVENSSALGAPHVGSLPDVVPEGTLFNMVLRRMYRPRSCSYQLLLEHQRPSRIQGLRWVSALSLPRPGTRAGGGPGLGAQACCCGPNLLCAVGALPGGHWVGQLGCSVCGWLAQPYRVSVGVWCQPARSGIEGRAKGFVIYLSPLCALS